MTYPQIINRLEELADPAAIEGMARYGITPERAYGVKIPRLREIAKHTGRNTALTEKLWRLDTRETRILASLIYEPEKVTPRLMDAWAAEFSYWEIVDACCMNLFEKTPHAVTKAVEWSYDEREFVKRAGYVLMARLAVSDKQAPDSLFLSFFPHIIRGAADNRNGVKKAVNWALRQIGKRNPSLNKPAISAAKELLKTNSKPARWIASDALRELESGAVQNRLSKR